MKVNFLYRILNNMGRKTAASSLKSRNLRVESLENRELLDASGLNDVALPPTDVEENPDLFVTEQSVGSSIDLSGLAVEDSKADDVTVAAPTVLEFGEYNVETETLPMKWTSVDDADGYVIEYTTDGGKTWKFGAKVGKDVTERLASKVHSDMEYIFRIQSYNETSVSEWTYSEPFYYTEAIPKAPHKFRLGEFDSSTRMLTMDWDKVGHVSGYRVQYTTDGGTSWYNSETLYGDDSTSRTAWSLYTDREYQFRVCSFNEVGSSSWTYSDKFHVNYDELDNPASFSIGEYNAADKTLATSWDAVVGATGYEVQYSLDSGKTWRLAQKLYSGDAITRFATNVVPGTTYEFRVRAFNEIGMSDWTYSELYTPPALLTPPSFVQVDDYNEVTRKLTLSWGDVPDEDGYKIEYSINNGDWTVAAKTVADVTHCDLENIQPNVFYTFRVRAYNETDVSPWVETPFYRKGVAYSELGPNFANVLR